jgi:hypothetical protein
MINGIPREGRHPSRADLADGRDGRRVLRISVDKKAQGFCGVWIHLFNSFEPPDSWIYLNAKPFTALSFWVRGQTGTEKMNLKLADASGCIQSDCSLQSGQKVVSFLTR